MRKLAFCLILALSLGLAACPEVIEILYTGVTGISLNETSIILPVGDTKTLYATIQPANATNRIVGWTSSNYLVAYVSPLSGEVTALLPGTATITVTTLDGGKKASCDVTVRLTVNEITLNKSSTSLTVGETETLYAAITPYDTEDKKVIWSSDKTSVATVTQDGVVKAIAPGEAIITAKAEDGGKSASCVVTVNPGIVIVAVSGVNLNKSSASLTVGKTETLTATVTPSDATNKIVIWTSSDPLIVELESPLSGLITAIAPGTATITVTTEDGGKTASCTVIVSNISVSGVSLNKSSTSLFVGNTETLSATVTPSDAANKNVTWNSSNSTIATVSADGLVTGISVGTAVITATTVDGGKTASCTVTVGNVPVSGVSLNKSSTSLFVGDTETLTAAIAPADAANKNVSWSSNNTAVAAVSGGVVSAVAAGTAVITVTTADGGKTAVCTVTVSNVAVSGVSLNKSSTGITVGNTETLTAIVAPSNAANKNVNWSSNNTAVATVSGGVVSAVSAGTAVITVTTADGGKTAVCTVTVSNISVSGVSLNKSSTSITVGNTETLTATVAPSNATNKNVTWSSNNTAIATVSGGVVTAVAAGMTTITATTVDGGKTASCTVNVSDVVVAVTGVNLNKSSTGITIGNTEILSATITPPTATNQNVTWNSGNTSVATVTAGGLVTAVSAGTATITVTTADGGKTANCTVTVNAINVTFSGVTANGSATQTTTQLTLNFSQSIPGLSASDITLSGVTGVSKGTLGGSGPSYTLPISGFTAAGTLSVTVNSPSGYNVTDSPRTTAIYAVGTAALNITFAQIADNAPNITGPTLYRVSNGGPTSVTLTVVDPGQYDSISWRVQNTAVTGTGSSFTLSAGNAAYNYIGEHFVTVLVMKDGVPYNKTVSFKVEY